MRVILTGATGRIGRLIAPVLIARGHQVEQAGRSGPLGDLSSCDEERWARELAGADAVIHLAALAHRRADAAAIDRINREATAAFGRAVARAGVGRFVFASSVYAASGASRAAPMGRDAAEPPAGVYGEAKRAAEGALAEALGPRLVCLRLAPALIGPPAGGVGALLALSMLPLPLPTASLANRRSFASPVTIEEAFRAALEGAATGAIPVADRTSIAVRDLVRAFRRGAGMKATDFACPPAALRPAFRALVGRERAQVLFGELAVDTAALEQAGARPASDSLDAAETFARRWSRRRQGA